jgi:transcriptional regulator with XRE-family HTH domain
MATRERRIDRGRRLARHALSTVGQEFREARLAAGLTQRRVAEAVGISHTELSRIERGLALWVPFETLVVIAAILGLDLPLRAFPAGGPIRDRAQIELLAKFRALLPTDLTWRTEVPLRIGRDLRAWDAVVGGRGWNVPVDAETRLRDVQALARRTALKRRDDGAEIMVLLVAGTRTNRHVLAWRRPTSQRNSQSMDALCSRPCRRGSGRQGAQSSSFEQTFSSHVHVGRVPTETAATNQANPLNLARWTRI